MFGKKLEDSRTNETVRGKQMRNKDGSQQPGVYTKKDNKNNKPPEGSIESLPAKDLPLKDSTKLMMAAFFDDLGKDGKKYADAKRIQISAQRSGFHVEVTRVNSVLKKELSEVGKSIDEARGYALGKISATIQNQDRLVLAKKMSTIKPTTDIFGFMKFIESELKDCTSNPKKVHAGTRNKMEEYRRKTKDVSIETSMKDATKIVDNELPKVLDMISRPFPKVFNDSLVTNRKVNNVIRDNARLYNELLKKEIEVMAAYVNEVQNLLKGIKDSGDAK